MSVATRARGESGSPARTRLLLLFAALLGALMMMAGTAHAGAVQNPAGCTPAPGHFDSTNSLPADDDGSSATAIPLGFSINFEGQAYSTAWVNNNGNITFDSALSTFTPSPIGSLGHPIIAPFWADVDTRGAASALTTFGRITYQGKPAFCVEWNGVGYYASHTDKINKFELILVSRPDRAAGDFDIIFNYDQIQWDTGDASGGAGGLAGPSGSPARVGFGLAGGGSEELSGSGTPGAFLDNGPAALVTDDAGSTTPGDYVFPVLGGQPQGEPGLHGLVTSHNAAVVNTPVQICPDPSSTNGASCVLTSTDGQGKYHVTGLATGLWNVTVNPVADDSIDLQTTVGPDQITGNAPVNQDIVMSTRTPPPTGTVVGGEGTWDGTQPALDWNASTPISTNGCTGATSATYDIVVPATTSTGTPTVIQSGPLSESPAGSGVFHGTITPLHPHTGFAQVRVTINCPPPSAPQIGSFDIYIDPAGHVVDQTGAPLAGATVTLQNAASAAGPFALVPNGSSIMAPNNRNNPSTTDSAGRFGWDTLAGFYTVTASKAGCINPTTPTLTSVTTGVLTVPPPVTDLKLTLNCDPLTNLTAVAQRDGSIKVSFQATGSGAVSANATTVIRVKSKAKKPKKSKHKGKAAKAKKHKKSKKKPVTKLKTVSYGSTSSKVPGVSVVTFTLKPSRSGKALLAQLKHLSVALAVGFKTTPTSTATTKTLTVAVKFVKPKKKAKKHKKKKH
jgi:Carboxypeptidase regulatory-like domain